MAFKPLKTLRAARQNATRTWQIARPVWHGWKSQFSLRKVLDRTASIKGSDILLFATLRNETWRMPYFLKHYRQLGVRHFLFVDNDSTDGFLDSMKNEPDCSVWHTTASYKASNFGMYWMNHLLRTYGTGHWCVTCDPDEFLVYPHCEERNLSDIGEFLRGQNQSHLFCLMLDMYSEGPWTEASCASGQDPLEVTPFFDATGYTQSPSPHYGEVFVQGGVRRRHFFRHDPAHAPAINKTPFVFWKSHYAYVSSMHMLNLKRLNRPHKHNNVSPTGCLLHFKFMANLIVKASEEIDRKQHYNNSVEYIQYLASQKSRDILHCEISRRYDNSRSLMQLGLMSPGQWF